MARVAWVESPLQMINALEYAQATGEALHICLRAGVPKLGDTGRGLVPHLPKRVTMSGPWDSAMRSPFATAKRRLVGDVCSGQVRAVLTYTGVRDLVMVDDGSAMLSTARRLDRGVALARHGKPESLPMRALGASTTSRLVNAMRRQRLALFTAYASAPEVAALAAKGLRVQANDYVWLRSADFEFGTSHDEHVVVGSALADDGYVRPEAYMDWLRALTAEGPVAYFPHRRETPASLTMWAAIPGVELRRTGLPIEVVIAAATHVKRVSTLPSSVVATLPSVLADDVEFAVTPVPEAWLTPLADQPLRDVLDTVVTRRASIAAV
ncbi:hypothetical protein [Demequina flava]|uniref:hypothetical protein n=1 Tax=Demequina flava TaxID=1095025 RepID=UPI0007862F24|nr:hypothetical protein [Demequina flava]